MRIPVITGPTATGKSALALRFAKENNGELVSADAYQVYRGMDIGTAKPTPEEQASVPHHLIDICDLHETWSAGAFFRKAEEAVADILSRGKLPVIVGGTGMYVDTLVNGMFDGPARDESFRAECQKRIDAEGLAALYAELAQVDPEYAAKVHVNDPVRIIRALEIYRLTGIPFTTAHKTLHTHPAYRYTVFVVERQREEMYSRINSRVVQMFRDGWVAEVQRLLSHDGAAEYASFKAIGYREIAEMLVLGGNEQGVVASIQQSTRNFAKRQMTWFRRMKDVKYISPDAAGFAEVQNSI